MRFERLLLGLAAITTLAVTVRADSTFVYTYNGAPMVSAQGALGGSANCATCTIDGSFTVASSLAPTQSALGANEQVLPLSYSFTATGMGTTLTQDNSVFNMFAAVRPSGDIYAFYFTISSNLGSISSDFYGSGFEFTDFYGGATGTVYAEGNY
jgi:hypothetical protein